MPQPLQYGVPLPPRAEELVPLVVSQKGESPLTVIVLNDTYYGTMIHWGGMTLPHFSEGQCPFCERLSSDPHWQGYLGVWSERHKDVKTLAISAGGCRQLLLLLARFQTLRGCKIELTRSDKTRTNSHLLVTLVERVETGKLKAAFDVRPSVGKLLGVNEAYFNSDGYRRNPNAAGRKVKLPPLPVGFGKVDDLITITSE